MQTQKGKLSFYHFQSRTATVRKHHCRQNNPRETGKNRCLSVSVCGAIFRYPPDSHHRSEYSCNHISGTAPDNGRFPPAPSEAYTPNRPNALQCHWHAFGCRQNDLQYIFCSSQGNKSGYRPDSDRQNHLSSQTDIAALHDQVLSVLYHGLDRFPNNRSHIGFQLPVVLGRQRGISAPDQSHFQMVERQIRVAVFFQKLLCKQCFARMRSTGNQKNHRFFSIRYQSRNTPFRLT